MLALAGLGRTFPAQAGWLLMPLLAIGLVGLGVAHGACDQLVLPARRLAGPGRGYFLKFGAGYLALAVAAGMAWWRWPGMAVGGFFLLTAWHWGSADAPALPRYRALWAVHSLLRGALPFAGAARWWPAEAQHSVEGLLAFAGAAPLAAGRFAAGAASLWPLVVAGHLALWGSYAALRQPRRWRTDMVEALLLTGLFWALPPLLALGVYFVFWHSLQHVLRLNHLFGYAATGKPAGPWAALKQELGFFTQRAWPLLLASVAALAALYAFPGARPPNSHTWLGPALAATAAVTLPHALLVSLVMDAPKWQPNRRSPMQNK
ncbi:MAG: Brp/Blh family beta-carotene 15,15'-dioxygenase [Janthinobacterium lividum]